MEKTESMNERALDKIESQIRVLLFDIRMWQDVITGKRVDPSPLLDQEQKLGILKYKNRELEILTHIKMKLEL